MMRIFHLAMLAAVLLTVTAVQIERTPKKKKHGKDDNKHSDDKKMHNKDDTKRNKDGTKLSKDLKASKHRMVLSKALHNDKKSDPVCVSLAVYEEAEFVDALVDNFLFFAEPSSRLVLHLDAESQYTDKQIKNWQKHGDRVAVSVDRVVVRPFQGSILWATMINARTMDQRWNKSSEGGPCAYFAFQASNMMWVRKGFEPVIRTRRFGAMGSNTGGCSKGIPFTDKLIAPKGVYAWNQPEGQFFPMETVRGFDKLLKEYLDELNDDGSAIANAKCYLEAFSLPTYALNYEEFFTQMNEAELLEYKRANSISWNHISYGGKDDDSVPLSEVKAIYRAESGWEAYYAVKRVNRNLKHEITRFIVSLAH